LEAIAIARINLIAGIPEFVAGHGGVLAIDAAMKSLLFLLCVFISCSSQHEHAFTA
jgi:hypothetical protein